MNCYKLSHSKDQASCNTLVENPHLIEITSGHIGPKTSGHIGGYPRGIILVDCLLKCINDIKA